jgi:hypothetical protein
LMFDFVDHKEIFSMRNLWIRSRSLQVRRNIQQSDCCRLRRPFL